DYIGETSAAFSKTVRAVASLASYDDLRRQMLELNLVKIIRELGLGIPRQLGKSLSSPIVPDDIERSREVLSCLETLAGY
ncbi:hypothetical protein FRC10_004038, partial [Ceratobasidium sp. 414]